MKKNIMVVILILISWFSYAQERENYGSLYFMPSVQFLNFDNLNTLLSQNGFPETGAVYAQGIGGFGTINRWRIGGEGVSFDSSPDNDAGAETTMNGGLGYFYAGYMFPMNKWQLTPIAGIGYGGVTVSAIRQSDGSLDDVIGDEPNAAVLSNGNALAHLGLMVERTIIESVYFGLKGGYNFALSKNEWEAAGLTSSVTDPFGGFQLNLVLGFILR